VGVFEDPELEKGSKLIYEAMTSEGVYAVVGGGDSVTAATKFKVSDKLGYICTGGGALIRFLTGEELPVIKALRFAAKRDA
jgi:phosphoglycerate kinase